MTINLRRRALFTIGQVKEVNTNIHLPWLKSTESFLNKCTQCQSCMENCPESIIEKGQGGYPTVNFFLGECTYCQECTKHCPEDLFDVEKEEAWSLNLIINDACFTEKGIVCQSCRDICELQAITFTYEFSSIPKPKVNTLLCTDCGACVSSCPANAISLVPDINTSIEIVNKD